MPVLTVERNSAHPSQVVAARDAPEMMARGRHHLPRLKTKVQSLRRNSSGKGAAPWPRDPRRLSATWGRRRCGPPRPAAWGRSRSRRAGRLGDRRAVACRSGPRRRRPRNTRTPPRSPARVVAHQPSSAFEGSELPSASTAVTVSAQCGWRTRTTGRAGPPAKRAGAAPRRPVDRAAEPRWWCRRRPWR